MKTDPKIYRLFSILSWCLTGLTAALEVYMLHLVDTYPGVEAFERNVRITGVLILLWVAASTAFTVMAIKNREK